MNTLQMQTSMILQGWVLYKGGLACSSRCSKRLQIDDAVSDTPLAIVQCAVNCLDKVVQCTVLQHHAGNMSSSCVI